MKELQKNLENEIQEAYKAGVTQSDAETLAAQFLYAQMKVSEELKKADLDSRMKKSGVKAVKAAIYLDAVQKADKKPSDTLLEHTINVNELVIGEQENLDKAEVDKAELERLYDVYLNAHIYMRGIAKGNFNG